MSYSISVRIVQLTFEVWRKTSSYGDSAYHTRLAVSFSVNFVHSVSGNFTDLVCRKWRAVPGVSHAEGLVSAIRRAALIVVVSLPWVPLLSTYMSAASIKPGRLAMPILIIAAVSAAFRSFVAWTFSAWVELFFISLSIRVHVKPEHEFIFISCFAVWHVFARDGESLTLPLGSFMFELTINRVLCETIRDPV